MTDQQYYGHFPTQLIGLRCMESDMKIDVADLRIYTILMQCRDFVDNRHTLVIRQVHPNLSEPMSVDHDLFMQTHHLITL